ncbi:DUF3822 family protein [Aequorivita echinoideorum]|uniref:DUF3822 family protein n=1 Tax=Aequorivita echinoideorum TaxID=1549647 RepID=UPI001FE92DED|nr:DUF3822 family protein [Aequorivita echinoideorum]
MIGLSFLVTNLESDETLFFIEKSLPHSTTPEELLIEIENTLSENTIFDGPFSEISIVYATSNYSLVPQTLFDESKSSEYLKFNSKILANDYIAHDRLETLGVVVVYVPFININNYFFERYGSFSYFHSTTILLNTLLAKENQSDSPTVHLHFLKNSFDCIIIKDGALQLCNTFQFKTPEDFIYYTLFCFEQLKLNPDTVPVTLYGDIDENNNLYKIAYTYIRNVQFADFQQHTKFIDAAMPHNHFILKNTL